MSTQKEQNLLDRGYHFTGIYTKDLEEAKSRARILRQHGMFATVVTKSYEGRIYNTTGHSVYAKRKDGK